MRRHRRRPAPFVERLDQRAATEPRERLGLPVAPEETDRRRSTLRHGWYWGTQAFAERLLALQAKLLPAHQDRRTRSTPEAQAHGEATARRLLEEGLQKAGLDAATVVRLPGSDPRKVALAAQIWEHTTASLSWISEHLSLRSPANASQQIRRFRQTQLLSESTRQSRNVA